MLKLDLSNPADIKLDIDFEGGPRLVPEFGKIDISGEDDLVDTKELASSIKGETVATAPPEEMTTSQNIENNDAGDTSEVAQNVVETNNVEKISLDNEFKEGVLDVIRTPEYIDNLKNAIQSTFEVDGEQVNFANIGNIPLTTYLSDNYTDIEVHNSVANVVKNAQNVFGQEAISTVESSVQSYFAKIMAFAMQELKETGRDVVEEIFGVKSK
jgi:hypothetical protein